MYILMISPTNNVAYTFIYSQVYATEDMARHVAHRILAQAPDPHASIDIYHINTDINEFKTTRVVVILKGA